jgi:hypothetical protein
VKNLPALAVLKQRIINNKGSSAFYLAAAILTAIPVIAMGQTLVKYSVNTPWWDQMSFVGLMGKAHNGTLSIYDLWAQHNEHRILVPQAFELITGKLTGYNFRVPVIMNFVFAAGSFGLLLSMLKRTMMDRKVMALIAIPFAWLLFSPLQWTNWIWGFQLVFFMCVFFTILTIWLLNRRDLLSSRLVFGLSMLSAGLATYCTGNGLLIWPIGLGLLLWRQTSRRRLVCWSAVGLAFIASYLFKFHRSPDSPTLLTVIKEPVAVVKYTLAYLGRNLASSPVGARYVATGLVVVFVISVVFIYKKGKLDRVLDWLALAAYVVLTGLLAAVSRLNFGIDHGFTSNSYPTLSVLFILAVIAVAAYALSLWVKDFAKARLPLYLSVFLIAGGLFAFPMPAFFANHSSGTFKLEDLSRHLNTVQTCIYTAKSDNDPCLLAVYPNKKAAWGYIQTLKQVHWDAFNSPRQK